MASRPKWTAAAVALTWLLCASPAAADPAPGACEYVAATKTVTYEWPDTRLSELPVIQRSGEEILVGRPGVDCGDATVGNTTLIRIVGSPPAAGDSTDLGMSIENGGFHTGTGDEIPIRIEDPGTDIRLRINAGPGDDHIVAGTLGVNLNAAEATDDVDVTVTDGEALTLTAVGCSTPECGIGDPGTTGADRFSVAGGSGTGDPMVTGFNRTGRLIGGEGGDHLTAGPLSTVIGGPGDDVLVGPGAVERTQVAFAAYTKAPAAVTVDLAAGTATGDGTDTLAGIGGVTGSTYADTLRGTDSGNTLNGGSVFFDDDAGDTIDGRGGDDDLGGYGGDDEIDGGAGADQLFGQNGDDVLRGGDGDDTLFADTSSTDDPAGDDRLEGGPGDDGMLVGDGDDTVAGGSGTDRIQFGGTEGGVTLDLAVTAPQDTGGAGIKTVTETENASGTEFTDTLWGTDERNVVLGGQGFGASPPPNADVLVGRGGDDLLILQGKQGGGAGDGGPGEDSVSGSEGPDTLDGGPGEDRLRGEEGDDKLRGPADRALDRLFCGAGTDEALYDDGLDQLEECELGGPGTPPDPDPAPGGDPPPPPPGPPAPPAPVVTPTPVTPPAPVAKELPASLLDAPKSNTRRCMSRRSFTIRLRAPGGIRYRQARVTLKKGRKTINRRLTPRRKGSRTTVKIDLRGLPRGKFTVRIVATTTDGRVLRGSRKYRTCAKRRRGGRIRV